MGLVGSVSAILIPLSTFFLTSWFLHYFPSFLHGRRDHRSKRRLAGSAAISDEPPSPDPRFLCSHIAHRGCRMEGIPENTLAAFQHALDSSAEIVEFDVWLTADGKVVAFHDADLERMTGVKGSISGLRYDELPPISLNKQEHWGVTDKNRHLALHIPLFEEVLDLLPPHVPIIIEFKQRSEVLVREVHDMIMQKKRRHQVIWFSLVETINTDLRMWDPSIPNIASVSGMLKVIVLYYLNLLPFWPLEEDILGVPIDEVDYSRVRGNAAFKTLPDAVCYVLAKVLGGKPPRALIPAGLFEHLRRRDIPVFFLGVNDDSDIEVAVRAGATAILTDRPKWLNERIMQGKVPLKRIKTLSHVNSS